MNPLITEPQLMEWSGHKRRDALVNWLRTHGIPYLLGHKGIVCVTSEAVNLFMISNQQKSFNSTDDIEF